MTAYWPSPPAAAVPIRPEAVLVAVRGALQRIDLRVPSRGEVRLSQAGGDGNLEVDRVEDVVLLEVRQSQRDPAHPVVAELVTPAAVRRAGHARHGPQGTHPVGALVVGEGQAELLQVVGALNPAGGLARRLHGGQQQRDQHGDDGDDHQQLDQRETSRTPSNDALVSSKFPQND